MNTNTNKHYYCPIDRYECPYSQKLHMGEIMNIHGVADYTSRLGWDYEILLPLFIRAFHNHGDAGIMELFYEMTDRRIDNIRNGYYIMTYYI